MTVFFDKKPAASKAVAKPASKAKATTTARKASEARRHTHTTKEAACKEGCGEQQRGRDSHGQPRVFNTGGALRYSTPTGGGYKNRIY
jgi:hypothetical protein